MRACQHLGRFPTWPLPNLPWVSIRVIVLSTRRLISSHSYTPGAIGFLGHHAPPFFSVWILKYTIKASLIYKPYSFVIYSGILQRGRPKGGAKGGGQVEGPKGETKGRGQRERPKGEAKGGGQRGRPKGGAKPSNPLVYHAIM